MSDKATQLFNKIVRPSMLDCDLSLPDFRIIQGAVMCALYEAIKQCGEKEEGQNGG